MKSYKVKRTIQVKVCGQDIINAVKKIASRPVINTNRVDGKDVFILGQISLYPYENLAITANGETEIVPEKTYKKITVSNNCTWDGWNYAVGYGHDDVIKAVEDFATSLKKKLLNIV